MTFVRFAGIILTSLTPSAEPRLNGSDCAEFGHATARYWIADPFGSMVRAMADTSRCCRNLKISQEPFS